MRVMRNAALILVAAACGQSPFEPNYTPTPVFTNPTNITNSYLPFSSMTKDVLVGTEGGLPFRVVRTRTGGTKAFTVNGQQVLAMIMIDSAFENNVLIEVAKDYYAQSDAGDVFYLGEDVDNYQNGQIVNHDGAWLYGVHTNTLGVIYPAQASIGQKFRSEDVPGITTENDEVVAVNETITVPIGTFQHCVRIKELLSDGAIEYKLYAPGVGVIKEIDEEGTTDVTSHT